MRADLAMFGDSSAVADGRLRKGNERKRLLIEATMRIIKQSGVVAVSKRTVAKEAGLPDSAVSYHFDSVDAMLLAAMQLIGDRYSSALRDLPDDVDAAFRQLAEYIADSAGKYRADVAAEYELFLMASRRPGLAHEQDRYYAALDAFAARVTPDPARRLAFAAAVDGLFFRAVTANSRITAAQAVGVMRACL